MKDSVLNTVEGENYTQGPQASTLKHLRLTYAHMCSYVCVHVCVHACARTNTEGERDRERRERERETKSYFSLGKLRMTKIAVCMRVSHLRQFSAATKCINVSKNILNYHSAVRLQLLPTQGIWESKTMTLYIMQSTDSSTGWVIKISGYAASIYLNEWSFQKTRENCEDSI